MGGRIAILVLVVLLLIAAAFVAGIFTIPTAVSTEGNEAESVNPNRDRFTLEFLFGKSDRDLASVDQANADAINADTDAKRKKSEVDLQEYTAVTEETHEERVEGEKEVLESDAGAAVSQNRANTVWYWGIRIAALILLVGSAGAFTSYNRIRAPLKALAKTAEDLTQPKVPQILRVGTT